MYEECFYSIYHLKFGKGFYHENPERTNLNWLVRKHPMDTKLRNSLEDLSKQFNDMGNKWGFTANEELSKEWCEMSNKLSQLIKRPEENPILLKEKKRPPPPPPPRNISYKHED
jgi:hypothetical protein